jgi:glutamate-1-semialdehyde aminotransferase
MPISAITGRREVMSLLEKDVFFFTTFGGEILSLAASLACIHFIRDHGVIDHLARIGQRLLDGLNQLIAELSMDYVTISGYPFRTLINFAPSVGNPPEMKTLAQQELLRRGILWSGIHTLCYAHTEEDIDYTLAAYSEVLLILKRAVETGNVRSWLKGEILEPVFRKTSHFNIKPKSRP